MQLQRAAPVPLALVAGIDHETPDPEDLRGIAVRHDEAHRIVVGVDGAKPGVWLEVGLGDRASVRCDVCLLLGLDRKIKNRSE